MDVGEESQSVVGEECHIVARNEDGPRGDSTLSPQHRDDYDNLVRLCSSHHKVIDDHPARYPADALRNWKRNHEDWVRDNLSTYNSNAQRDDETYAGYVQYWAARADLQNWKVWASPLACNGQPQITLSRLESLEELNEWLLRRAWPDRSERLQAGFVNFRRVLNDLLATIRGYGHEIGTSDSKIIEVEKRYQNLGRWNPEAYNKKLAEFRYAVDLIEDLAFELTRAANLLCQLVRDDLIPTYRLAEGNLSITTGPNEALEFKTTCPQYAAGVALKLAYPGLPRFLTERAKRDVSFGHGTLEDYQIS